MCVFVLFLDTICIVHKLVHSKPSVFFQTHYLLGYNVPSYEYLYSERGSDRYVLNMRLLDHIFDDMIVDDFELTIILPEGCEVRPFSNAINHSRKIIASLFLKKRK